MTKKKRRKITKSAQREEVFWWIDSRWITSKIKAPRRDEADGLIFSPTLSVTPFFGYQQWTREIKKLVSRYPCTRVMVHFDLRGVERDSSGRVRTLSWREARFLQRYASLYWEKAGGDAWRRIRHRPHGEEKEALFWDLKTVRRVLAAIDRLNLAGVLFCGGDQFFDLLEEARSFFMVAPRSSEMKEFYNYPSHSFKRSGKCL